MKTSELTGAALDYWVTKAEGRPADVPFTPSTDWSDGGPIIERERIGTQFEDPIGGVEVWGAGWRGSIAKTIPNDPNDWHHGFGPTPLIAAMRAYVSSRFGEEVPDAEK